MMSAALPSTIQSMRCGYASRRIWSAGTRTTPPIALNRIIRIRGDPAITLSFSYDVFARATGYRLPGLRLHAAPDPTS